jgi:hypothetical protein
MKNITPAIFIMFLSASLIFINKEKPKRLYFLRNNKLLLYLFFCIMFFASCTNKEYKNISSTAYLDKVRGGWAGKMIGVMYGAPYEFRFDNTTYDSDISWDPESVKGALSNDDLYVQLGFMQVMDSLGRDCSAESFAAELAGAKFELCHANRMARRNFNLGIMPPLSGNPVNNMHADDIDFQIESDFIGYINPGMPVSSDGLCNKIGHIMCYGDGVYGGMYIAALNSMAFFESNIDSLVCKALLAIPSESQYAQCIRDVIEGYRVDPQDWHATWEKLTLKWGNTDICVPNHPFNIDARLNGVYVVLALLYGNGDFGKTMEIAVRCGQDTDCNSSSSAGILGVIKGYSAIDERWKKEIPSIENNSFSFTNYTLKKAVERSFFYAKANAVRNGGRVSDTQMIIKTQKPEVIFPPEVSFPHLKYSYQSTVLQPEWHFKGSWNNFVIGRGDNDIFKCTSSAGDELELRYKGKCILLQGYCNNNGGKADIYIDNEFVKTIDFYYRDEAGIYLGNRAHLFHIISAEDKEHVIRLVTRNDKNQLSSGKMVWIERALIYK